MILLYKYIFYRIYFFYVKRIKEKEIPQYFSSAVVSVIFLTNLNVIIDAYTYFFNRALISYFDSYYKYSIVLIILCISIYVNTNKRYIQIINRCKELTIKKQRILSIYSILYVAIVFICFFWLGYLIREYNKTHLY